MAGLKRATGFILHKNVSDCGTVEQLSGLSISVFVQNLTVFVISLELED